MNNQKLISQKKSSGAAAFATLLMSLAAGSLHGQELSPVIDGRIYGCTAADDEPGGASIEDAGRDPLATCNRPVDGATADLAGRSHRSANLAGSTGSTGVSQLTSGESPGWVVVTGTVRSFSGKTGSRPYDFSVARVKNGSVTGVLLSVKRGSNTWFDRRVVQESQLKEFATVQPKLSFGDIFNVAKCVVKFDFGCVANALWDILVKELGPELAKAVSQALNDIIDYLKEQLKSILADGSLSSKALIGNLKKSADQTAVENYVKAVRDYSVTGSSIDLKVYNALQLTIRSSRQEAAQALAQTIVDLP